MRHLIAAAMLLAVLPAEAREGPQWAQLQPGETEMDRAARSAWFNRQKMPDNPGTSCCGEGDAYYADSVEVDKVGNVFAIVTDERPDSPLSRPHIKPGTKILIPPWKNKDTRSDPNPTGHTIIFVRWYNDLGLDGDWGVLCYLPEGGV